MEKSEKEKLVRELNDKFSRAKSAILAEFTQLNVETVNKLRRKLREGGVEYKVLKNTLAKRAARGTSIEPLSDQFEGPLAMALSYGDVLAPAKILSDFIKGMEKIKVRGAVVEGKKLDAAGVQALAKLPGLLELRAQILGLIQQPAGKLVRTVAEPGARLARTLKAKAEKQ